jgi:hypothetical protein
MCRDRWWHPELLVRVLSVTEGKRVKVLVITKPEMKAGRSMK